MIDSRYSQAVRSGAWQPLKRFIDPFEPLTTQRTQGMFRDFLCYDRLIDLYQQRFGKDKVLALPFEILRRDRVEFIARIAEFAGARMPDGDEISFENTKQAIPANAIPVRRFFNHFFSRDIANPFSLVLPERGFMVYARGMRLIDAALRPLGQERPKKKLRRAIDGEIGAYYAESNRRTSDLIGTDLGDLGYSV